MSSWSSWFWSSDFWLPPNVTWSDLDHSRYPSRSLAPAQFNDLLIYPLPLAIVVLVIRYVIEKHLLRRLGRAIGMRDGSASKHVKGKSNGSNENGTSKTLSDAIDKFVSSHPTWSDSDLVALSKQTDLSSHELRQRLQRLKRGQSRSSPRSSRLAKFCESGWKAFFYCFSYSLSWVVLYDKPWFWEINYCWLGYPLHHPLSNDIWFYYQIEIAYYLGALFSQFSDVRRSDFVEMFCHHVATLLLLSLSWTCNLIRVGTLVLWAHDCADCFLETAKMLKYAGPRFELPSHLLFYGFTISWVVTRLGYFPTWILFSITTEAGHFVQYFKAYTVFSALLSVLLVLNCFWFYYIVKVGYISLLKEDKKVEKDLRSDDDDEDDDD